MKKLRFKVNKNEFIELKNMDYEVHQLTPWHFRVFRDSYKNFLDVFPTTHVYLLFKNSKYIGKGNYDDLREISEEKLDACIN